MEALAGCISVGLIPVAPRSLKDSLVTELHFEGVPRSGGLPTQVSNRRGILIISEALLGGGLGPCPVTDEFWRLQSSDL